MSGVPVTRLDDTPIMTGTHSGGDGASVLVDRGKDFRSCGADPSLELLLKNTTDGSEGALSASTESTMTCTLAGGTDNAWDTGDEYELYATDEEDSHISTHYTDRLFGRKVVNQAELNEDGRFHEDEDLDEETFGPGHPLKKFW